MALISGATEILRGPKTSPGGAALLATWGTAQLRKCLHHKLSVSEVSSLVEHSELHQRKRGKS